MEESENGRITKRTVEFGNDRAEYRYGYEKVGGSVRPDNRMKTETFGGSTVRYGYDESERLKEKKTELGVMYEGTGSEMNVIEISLTQKYSYVGTPVNTAVCAADRTTALVSKIEYEGNGYEWQEEYEYDSRGNLERIVTDGHSSTTYEYDRMNRLTVERNGGLGKNAKYEYDGSGNMIRAEEEEYSGVTVNRTYVYDAKGRLTEVSENRGNSEVKYEIGEYDLLGNPCKYRGIVLEWKRGRNLTKYGNVSYEYDAGGIRQKKTVNGTQYSYWTEGGKIHREYRSNGVALWYYYDSTGIEGFQYNGTRYHYFKNLQGDIVGIIDGNGKMAAEYRYDAWGNHKVYDGERRERRDTDFIGNINPFRYRGYYYDAETGLYYLQSRYYDPAFGRFINADDAEILTNECAGELGGLNLYAYCNNNPVMYADEDGYFVLSSFLIGLAISAAVGALAGAVSYVGASVIGFGLSGEWNWSWGMFLGSAIGGMFTGMFDFVSAGATGIFAAGLNSLLSTAIGMSLENAFGEANHSLGEIAISSFTSAVLATAFAGITAKIKIPQITGRGGIGSVSKQIFTKFRNGIIKKITLKTFGKIFAYDLYTGAMATAATGVINAIIALHQQRIRNRPKRQLFPVWE